MPLIAAGVLEQARLCFSRVCTPEACLSFPKHPGNSLRTSLEAAARGLPVAEISAHFLPPWTGKFAPDCFHPSQDGYRDWSRALLFAL